MLMPLSHRPPPEALQAVRLFSLWYYSIMDMQEEKKVTNEKPISLAGVGFKKLMSAFLKVKPEEEKQEGKPKAEKPSK